MPTLYHPDQNGHLVPNQMSEHKIKDLDYCGEGGLAPASKPQRSFIHGLCDELDYNCHALPFYVADIDYMTVAEASDIIELLIQERDEKRRDRGIYRRY